MPFTRTSVKLNVNETSESSTPPGAPTIASYFAKPDAFAVAPFASGDPIVSCMDSSSGEAQEADASGGPWMRFGEVHGR